MGIDIRQLSFRKQVLVLTSTLLLVSSLIVAIATAWVAREELKSQLFAQGKEWSESLARNSVSAFLYRDAEVVRDSVQTIIDSGKVDSLMLAANDGQIILQQGDKKTSGDYKERHGTAGGYSEDSKSWFYSVAVLSSNNSAAKREQGEDDFIDTALSIEQKPQLLGYIHLALSKRPLDLASREVFVNNLVIALVFSVLIIMLLMVFVRRLFSPLEDLAHAMGQTRQGDWINVDGDSGSSEIQDMANAYNAMINALQERDDELVRTNTGLEKTVAKRTEELEDSNKQLEAFNYSVSHDLRAPLRSIDGFSKMLLEDYAEKLDDDGKDYIQRVRKSTKRMGDLIDDMLKLSRITRHEIKLEDISLDVIANEILEPIMASAPDRKTEIHIEADLATHADPGLVWIMLENLIGNAWKYSSKSELTYLALGCDKEKPGTFYLKDKGAGFDMQYAGKLFSPFQRLHKPEEFEGTGIGLATVKRIIDKHGGKVWVEAGIGKGATFYFSFGEQE